MLGVWGGAAPGPRSTGSYLWGTTLLILRTGSGLGRVWGVVPGIIPSDIDPWGTSSPAITTINSVPQNTAAWSSSLLALGGGRDMILGLATNARPRGTTSPSATTIYAAPQTTVRTWSLDAEAAKIGWVHPCADPNSGGTQPTEPDLPRVPWRLHTPDVVLWYIHLLLHTRKIDDALACCSERWALGQGTVIMRLARLRARIWYRAFLRPSPKVLCFAVVPTHSPPEKSITSSPTFVDLAPASRVIMLVTVRLRQTPMTCSHVTMRSTG